MKSVIIEKDFFDLENPLSMGLISGLKKLTEREVRIILAEKEYTINPELNKILRLEDIFIDAEINKSDEMFFIKTKQISDEKFVFIEDDDTKFENFYEAAVKITKQFRKAEIKRYTNETKINAALNLDGSGVSEINTGLGFFDHMLDQIARHSNIDLSINCSGDLQVDEHHTVEDTALALGEAILKALGEKKGINRYGFFLPMDDSIAECAIDLGGRPYLNFNVKFNREKVGDFPTELVEEFFKSLSSSMKANIFIKADGKNEHHKIESVFKAFARALNEALKFNPRNKQNLPTTKGVL